MKTTAWILLFLAGILSVWGLTGVRAVEMNLVEVSGGQALSNTYIFLLLLPLVASIVSVLHYVVGISGYGTYMPTMVAVGFLATGIFGGILLFAVILGISVVGNRLIRKLHLHYWPGRSINLIFISVGVYLVLKLVSGITVLDVSKVSIFPIMFMIVLSEEFVKVQLAKSKREARELLLGTILLSMVGAGIMGTVAVQAFVQKYPALLLLGTLVLNIWVGRYGGMRMLEYKRFRKAVARVNKNQVK